MAFYRRRPRPDAEKCADPAKARASALEAGDLDVVEGVARLCDQTVLHALLTACKVDLGGRVGLFQSTGNGQCGIDMSGSAAGCDENTHGDSSL